jgi:prepilin-type N-terminal cleavage/methylation domain-containing protein
MKRRIKQTGFTLLELLVAVTVVSLLSTTILFGWRIAANAWGRASELVEEQRRVAATHELLQEQMAAMVPYSPWVRQGRQDVFFQGEPQTARFLSRYSLENRSGSGLYLVEYQMAETLDGTCQLLFNEIPLRNPEEAGALFTSAEESPAGPILRFSPVERTAKTRVLLERLAQCRMEYYRPAESQQPGRWTEQWISRGTELPRGMAIRIESRAEPNELRPVSVVAGITNYTRAQR